jgi:hypothetical protein
VLRNTQQDAERNEGEAAEIEESDEEEEEGMIASNPIGLVQQLQTSMLQN